MGLRENFQQAIKELTGEGAKNTVKVSKTPLAGNPDVLRKSLERDDDYYGEYPNPPTRYYSDMVKESTDNLRAGLSQTGEFKKLRSAELNINLADLHEQKRPVVGDKFMEQNPVLYPSAETRAEANATDSNNAQTGLQALNAPVQAPYATVINVPEAPPTINTAPLPNIMQIHGGGVSAVNGGGNGVSNEIANAQKSEDKMGNNTTPLPNVLPVGQVPNGLPTQNSGLSANVSGNLNAINLVIGGGASGNNGNFGGGNAFGNINTPPNVPPNNPMQPIMPQNANSAEEYTLISRNTVVDGHIRSFANMAIEGDIKGDVETTKNIDLGGRVVGNLTCNNALLHNSKVQGNISLKGNVEMQRDTILIGDLVSTYADLNGKIKGNLNITGKAQLKEDSVIFGDISASTITVDDGAIIQGYVSTTFLNKEESRNIFPEQITIGEG